MDGSAQVSPFSDVLKEFATEPWRGGYNSGKLNSTNNLYLNTELGINRVAVRPTLTAGTITVTARRDGLKSAQVQIASKPVVVTDGIATFWPQRLKGPAES
jgi:beta-galactosidase